MLKKLFLLVFLNGLITYCVCQNNYWQQQVNCKIDVTLNDTAFTLDGYIKMEYINNSPDTLHFIWIHLWENAYKNDRTAFTDQTLENGSTKFYFSSEESKGYINQLDFKVDGKIAKLIDHPIHQDIVKLILPNPLLPNSTAKIETPFRVKLPQNISRGGHVGQSFQITQWYPKPAVYDKTGWHEMPYLNQGEFYAEFGDYDVQITLPSNYIIASTGEIQENSYKDFLQNNNDKEPKNIPIVTHIIKNNIKKTITQNYPSAINTITVNYKQNHVHDFAWFADKTFLTKYDTLQLPSGKVIEIYAFYFKKNSSIWKNCVALIKSAILTKSKWLGDYPYKTVSVVDDASRVGGGMEYPTITLLDAGGSEQSLDVVINHEVGHNWFEAALATNERLHPWMDEGMNTYYDNRYAKLKYGNSNLDFINTKSVFLKKRIPNNISHTLLEILTSSHNDQPIETSSEKFSAQNYGAIAYQKTGEWMKYLETEMGKTLFDSAMQAYYKQWSFKHPYPNDFKNVLESLGAQNIESSFSLLNKKGNIQKNNMKKDFKLMSFFSFKDVEKHHYIFASPAVGINFYDGIMLGVLFHNYTLPASKFQFIIAPLYATKSKQVNGLARLQYTYYPNNSNQKIIFSLAASSFSGDNFTDSTNYTKAQRFSKIVPAIKYVFANLNPRSNVMQYLEWKTFFIQEQGLYFTEDPITHIQKITFPTSSRYLNQLQYYFQNTRVLYPYNANFKLEQGDAFIRLSATANYFFNYAKGGGLNVRVFAGKFFYTIPKTFVTQYNTDAYHLNMTAPNGYEDYTYSNYFYGRNEFENFSSHQIMERDGAFKIQTDLLSYKIGKTDNWLAAANFTTSIPKAINPFKLLPFNLPIKAFLDMGTYAEAWKKNAETGKLVYDAGLQVSLFNNVLNIYVPLLYSKVYKNYFNSYVINKIFQKKITFSINFQNILPKKYTSLLEF